MSATCALWYVPRGNMAFVQTWRPRVPALFPAEPEPDPCWGGGELPAPHARRPAGVRSNTCYDMILFGPTMGRVVFAAPLPSPFPYSPYLRTWLSRQLGSPRHLSRSPLGPGFHRVSLHPRPAPANGKAPECPHAAGHTEGLVLDDGWLVSGGECPRMAP